MAGCRRSGRPVVGIIPNGGTSTFWQMVHAGAVKSARERNFDVDWNAPSIESDSSRQIAIPESVGNRRLAGLFLAPVDRKGLVLAKKH